MAVRTLILLPSQLCRERWLARVPSPVVEVTRREIRLEGAIGFTWARRRVGCTLAVSPWILIAAADPSSARCPACNGRETVTNFPSHGDSPCSSFLRSAGMGGDPHDAQGSGLPLRSASRPTCSPVLRRRHDSVELPGHWRNPGSGCGAVALGTIRPRCVTLRAAHFRAFGHPVSHHFSHHCSVTGWTSRLRHHRVFNYLALPVTAQNGLLVFPS